LFKNTAEAHSSSAKWKMSPNKNFIEDKIKTQKRKNNCSI
jgi:hypothetical protein